MDTGHQRCIGRKRGWQGNRVVLELPGGIGQVKLIEYGVLPVTGHLRPVLPLVVPSLLEEAAQVGTFGQLVAVDWLVDAVAPHFVVAVADGRHVNALSRLQRDVPVVARHAGDDVVAGEMPALGNVGVLYPDVGVLLGEGHLADGVLHKDGGVGLAVQVHDFALVADECLHGCRRGNHFARSAEMVELAAWQRKDGHL